MANNNNDDGIAVLIDLGFLAVVGIGVLKVLKAIAEYEPNQTISTAQAAKLASSYTPSYASNYERTPNCEIHGMDADLCENCHGCMECLGRDDDQFCVNWLLRLTSRQDGEASEKRKTIKDAEGF